MIHPYLFLKSFIDRVVALLLLLLFLPTFLIIIPAQCCVYGWGDVFFVQKRIGKGEHIFRIIKFTTLYPDTKSPRQNHWGNLLRKTHLDEIPQLINVLKGEMSMVGPRPLLVEYLPHYTPRQARRHEVHAGITGLAQVNGAQALDWDTKMALDYWYVTHISFGLDLYILFRTILKAFALNTEESHEGRKDLKDRPPSII